MLDFIAAIVDLPARVAGSAGERMGQALLAGRLDELGFRAVLAGAVCAPRIPVILGLHSLFFLGSALLAVFKPGFLALALSGLTLLSTFGELRGKPRLLRRLLLKRMTTNMIAVHERQQARGRLVLVAHGDVSPSSSLLLPWARRWYLDRERPGRSVHPASIVLIAGFVQLCAAAQRWAGEEHAWLGVVAVAALFGAALVHLGTLALALDWWRSPAQQGAVSNASGMAVALAVAESLKDSPLENLEVWVVVSGARQPDSGGMKGFLYQFGHLLDRDSTWFINLDAVGAGQLGFALAEGRWRHSSYRPAIPDCAATVAAADEFRAVRSFSCPGGTDAGPVTRAGYRAITLSGLVDGRAPGPFGRGLDGITDVDDGALTMAHGFALALAREIDARQAG
tara:strand:- start:3270 stop:4457 length:1188 start_codon:yes stop_codon:yes gene_type:complete